MDLVDSGTLQTIRLQPSHIAAIVAHDESKQYIHCAARAIATSSRNIFVVGTGSSLHASQMTQFLFRDAGLLRTWAVSSFDFALYPQPVEPNDVVIVYSHRGTKSFSVKAIEKSKELGCTMVLITGQGSSLTHFRSDKIFVIETVPNEISSCHTSSYTGALTVATLIAIETAKQLNKLDNAQSLQTCFEHLLALFPTAIDTASWNTLSQAAAEVVADRSARLVFVGAGAGGIAATELALKVKEACYITAEGFPVEQFLHGPLVGYGKGDHVVIFSSRRDGEEAQRVFEVCRACVLIGMKVWLIGELPDGSTVESLAGVSFANVWGSEFNTESDPSGFFANLCFTIHSQVFACFCAQLLHTDPDSFREEHEEYSAAVKSLKL
eukprot:GILK01003657.1.p1 GENE.GILK01003657.1~~GILK01003657.1.p1  ORF type:complete len:381 (-),score=48.60 GILK01003657.1:169-1311(-)